MTLLIPTFSLTPAVGPRQRLASQPARREPTALGALVDGRSRRSSFGVRCLWWLVVNTNSYFLSPDTFEHETFRYEFLPYCLSLAIFDG